MESAVAIKSQMTRFPVVASQEMRLDDAKATMSKLGIRHLPVIEDGRVVGIISERDILRAGDAGAWAATVADFMQHDVLVAAPDAPLASVVRQMHEKKLGSAVVVDRWLNATGIFTVTDALRLLAETLSRPDPAAQEALERTIGEFFEWDAGWGESFLGNRDCVAAGGK